MSMTAIQPISRSRSRGRRRDPGDLQETLLDVAAASVAERSDDGNGGDDLTQLVERIVDLYSQSERNNIEIGQMLHKIREEGLYPSEHGSFSGWIDDVLPFDRSRASQLITAYRDSQTGVQTFANEHQARKHRQDAKAERHEPLVRFAVEARGRDIEPDDFPEDASVDLDALARFWKHARGHSTAGVVTAVSRIGPITDETRAAVRGAIAELRRVTKADLDEADRIARRAPRATD